MCTALMMTGACLTTRRIMRSNTRYAPKYEITVRELDGPNT